MNETGRRKHLVACSGRLHGWRMRLCARPESWQKARQDKGSFCKLICPTSGLRETLSSPFAKNISIPFFGNV